jgi:hypothetical protein
LLEVNNLLSVDANTHIGANDFHVASWNIRDNYAVVAFSDISHFDDLYKETTFNVYYTVNDAKTSLSSLFNNQNNIVLNTVMNQTLTLHDFIQQFQIDFPNLVINWNDLANHTTSLITNEKVVLNANTSSQKYTGSITIWYSIYTN